VPLRHHRDNNGLSIVACLTGFFIETGVFQGQGGLVGETLRQLYFLMAKDSALPITEGEDTN
jgi:hypothetical protein